MSTTQDLVIALKAELRNAGLTYADLAEALGMSESSVKRVFAKADMPLSRIDEILRVLKMDFAELAGKVVDSQPLAKELTEQQEAAVVADRRLLLLAICCLSQWTFEEITRDTRSATPSASSTWPGSTTWASSSSGRSTATGSRSRRAFAGGRTDR